jgi:hypothetical protein
MFLNQGTRQPNEASQEEEASQKAKEEKKVNGDMASAWEELDDVQLATVVGGTVMGRQVCNGDGRCACGCVGAVKVPFGSLLNRNQKS